MSTLPPGVHRTQLQFAHPDLSEYQPDLVEIVGASPGPRLCIIAGMHINEVSSIEAALRLPQLVNCETLKGRISIIPILNYTGWTGWPRGAMPQDGKNINFCFPGREDGTFSDVLAQALLEEWAKDAICLMDLHGADLGEKITRYTICQLTGDADFDQTALGLARAFDVDSVITLPPEIKNATGRSVTGRAAAGQYAAFAECGEGGILNEDDIRYHLDGVARVAALFEMGGLKQPSEPRKTPAVLVGYEWLTSPATGWLRTAVDAGTRVHEGDLVATVQSLDGSSTAEIRAPRSGLYLWQQTHPVVSENDYIGGIGYEE